jgi:hypothetical protein
MLIDVVVPRDRDMIQKEAEKSGCVRETVVDMEKE